MMRFFLTLGSWMGAVVRHWHGWVGGATLAIFLLVGQQLLGWQPTLRQFIAILGFGLLWSMFAAWAEERDSRLALETKATSLETQLQEGRKDREHDRLPDLVVMPRDAIYFHVPDIDKTFVLIETEIVNKGADTFALIANPHYKSPTLDADVGIALFTVTQDIATEPDRVLTIEPYEWLTAKTRNGSIQRGKMESGRVPIVIDGNRTQEMSEGAEITFEVQDYLGKTQVVRYQGGPALGHERTPYYPGERLRPRSSVPYIRGSWTG